MSTPVETARALALALPETVEQDHHGIPSFRVRGRIFATLPDADHLRIMLEEGAIHAAVALNPTVCQEFYWGRRLACVVVHLADASPEQVCELLSEAWLHKAPPTLARTYAARLTGAEQAVHPPT